MVEFNCRFGDPESQVMLPRMEGDLVPLLFAVARGERPPVAPWTSGRRAAVCVAIASGGYPGRYRDRDRDHRDRRRRGGAGRAGVPRRHRDSRGPARDGGRAGAGRDGRPAPICRPPSPPPTTRPGGSTSTACTTGVTSGDGRWGRCQGRDESRAGGHRARQRLRSRDDARDGEGSGKARGRPRGRGGLRASHAEAAPRSGRAPPPRVACAC